MNKPVLLLAACQTVKFDRLLVLTAFVLATNSAISTRATAQAISTPPAYPAKPIRFVVPFSPGGTIDFLGRLLGEKLSQRLHQTVVIDNRPGASGNIGMDIVARSPADGYTIIIAAVGSWAMNPHLYKLSYDVVNDFAPIIHVAAMPGVMAVHPSVPVKTVKEYIALARQRPGELTYGTAGVGTFAHVSGELLSQMTGVKLTHVPYKGSGPALLDLVGGHISSSFESITPALPHITAGRVRALATTGATRSQVLPDLPTIAEAGVTGFDNPSWAAIGAPARTPRPIVELLNKEINGIMQMPEFTQAIRLAGGNITGGAPEQFRDYLKSELAKFGKLVKDLGMKIDG